MNDVTHHKSQNYRKSSLQISNLFAKSTEECPECNAKCPKIIIPWSGAKKSHKVVPTHAGKVAGVGNVGAGNVINKICST